MAARIQWKALIRRTIEEEFVVPITMTPTELCPLLEAVLDHDVTIPEKITQAWLEANVSPWRLLDVLEIYSGHEPARLIAERTPDKSHCSDVFISTCEFHEDP